MNVTEQGSSSMRSAAQIAAAVAHGVTSFKQRHGLLKPMTPETLTVHMLRTYSSLRRCLLLLAIALPLVLVLTGYAIGHVGLQHSLSAYYWAGLDDPSQERTIFVGALFAVGACLIAYRGFSNEENWALNIAGILAWGVALFPMDCSMDIVCAHGCAGLGYGRIHGSCAVAFFLLLAYVALFRSKDTLGDEHEDGEVLSGKDRRMFIRLYNIAAVAMIVLPIAAVIVTLGSDRHPYAVIAVECAAVWAFAYYWGIKSWEMSKSQLERRAARQDVQADSVGKIRSTRAQILDAGNNGPRLEL